MRLRWTPSAAADLESIHAHVSGRWPSMTTSTLQLVYKTVRSLRTFPTRGRLGLVPGTRELVFARLPYIVVYRVAGEIVEVLRIYHGAQDR